VRGVRGLPGSLLKCVCALAIAVFLVRPGGSAEEGKATSGGELAPELPGAIETPGAVVEADGAAPAEEGAATLPADDPDQDAEAAPPVTRLQPGQIVEVPLVPAGEGSDIVTINVVDGNINDVLNVFSLQTGRDMVIGPDVTNTVTLRLNETQWEDALEVMLKPYGYGHKMVGETIIVNKLDKIQEVEQAEPLAYKVYDLKYLDAFGVIEMIRAQLTDRGHVSTVSMRGQRGWGFAKGESEGSGSGTGGKRERMAAIDVVKEREYEEMRSKLIVVADIPSVLLEIDTLIKDVDHMPMQVLIEARFVEVSTDVLHDVGVQMGTGVGGARSSGPQTVAVASDSSVSGIGAQSTGGGALPAAFKSQSTGLSGQQPFNAGASFLFQQLTDVEFEVMLHALEEEGGLNVLSAPRILTINNQEATIMVGEKYPIIRSDVSGQYGGSSTSIDYWQDIGIQLNVVPQICAKEYIRMIVHPAVTEQIGTASGRTVSGAEGGIVPVTDYPILSTREAETQIVIKDGETIIIGGLLKDIEATSVFKVPILGDIPLLGNLFKRKTTRVEQLDLLIFLTASVVDPERNASTP
jgi:type IV pilus assembly protein PilQ